MFQRMKRVALIALTAMILVVSVAATASAVKVKSTTNLNVRKSATTSSKVLTVMPKNTSRTVLGTSKNGKWYKVKMNGKTGYVSKSRVKIVSTSTDNMNGNQSSSSKKVKLGKFKITFYGDDTITASGKTPKINHTIAVDPRVIKLGTKVYIEGMGTYYAEDTGGAIKGNILDVFVRTEREASRLGIRYANVYVYK